MTEFITVHKFDKAQKLLEALTPWSDVLGGSKYIFRGHSSSDYLLSPTSFRQDPKRSIWDFSKGVVDIANSEIDNNYSLAFVEYQLIRDFYKFADARGLHVPASDRMRNMLHEDVDLRSMSEWIDGEGWLPDDMLEVAALAQHYGIATRLLDWTYDPFVAGYFASKPSDKAKGELCIWGLNIDVIGTIDTPNLIGWPLKLITPHYSGNPNLAAQSGLFTHWNERIPSAHTIRSGPLARFSPVDRRPLDVQVKSLLTFLQMDGSGMFVKMTLPGSESVELARLLRKLGYGPARLFPGYEGVAMEIKDRPFLR